MHFIVSKLINANIMMITKHAYQKRGILSIRIVIFLFVLVFHAHFENRYLIESSDYLDPVYSTQFLYTGV